MISYYLVMRPSLIVSDVYPPGDASIGYSTIKDHTSKSKVKEATSLITQEFNSTLKKEEESNASALAEVETLEFRM